MIKVLLLDADGVIIKGKQFSAELEKEFGISRETTKAFFIKEFERCVVGAADLKEELQKYVSKWGWKDSVEKMLEYWFALEHSIDNELVDFVKSLEAKGIPSFIATNQEKYRAGYIAEKMGLAKIVKQIFASAHLGVRKPDQNFFHQVVEKIGNVDKSEIVFWDDDQRNVDGARKYGLQAELYTTFENFKKVMKEKYLIG